MSVVQERDGSNNPLVSYTRGNDLSGTMQGAGGIGGLLARSDGYSGGNFTTHNYYFADGNGNVTYMLNSSQSMVASYRYDPFGNTISSSGTLASANVYRFSSKEIHVSSGMYYYGYRFYDPNLQRWITRDPIREHGGINLYRFAQNRALNIVDRFGLQVQPPGVEPFPGPRTMKEPGNPLSNINNEMNHGEVPDDGEDSFGDRFLQWLADKIARALDNESTPEQAEWDKQYGPGNPFWPPDDGRQYLIPGRPPNHPPPNPNRPPQTACPTQVIYSPGPGNQNGPPTSIIR